MEEQRVISNEVPACAGEDGAMMRKFEVAPFPTFRYFSVDVDMVGESCPAQVFSYYLTFSASGVTEADFPEGLRAKWERLSAGGSVSVKPTAMHEYKKFLCDRGWILRKDVAKKSSVMTFIVAPHYVRNEEPLEGVTYQVSCYGEGELPEHLSTFRGARETYPWKLWIAGTELKEAIAFLRLKGWVQASKPRDGEDSDEDDGDDDESADESDDDGLE